MIILIGGFLKREIINSEKRIYITKIMIDSKNPRKAECIL
jgi:hypothetical protein